MQTVKRFSPSTLSHLDVCPGWIPEPKEFKGKSADEGQLLHKSLETGNLKGLGEEQAICVRKVRAVFDKAVWEMCKTTGFPAQLHREKWVGIEDFNRGIIDELAISANLAFIGDAKFGHITVEDAETNPQGLSYVTSIFEEFPQVEKITLKFVQPRCDLITTATFDRKVYHTILLRLKRIRADVTKFSETQDFSMLHPQENNCAYCGNLSDCPALGNKALALAGGYDLAHDGELPDLFNPSQLATPERRAQAERLRKVMVKWCASVQKHNIAHRLSGEEIPGYELKSKKCDRSITQPAIAWKKAQEITHSQLTQEDFAEACTVSLPQLKDVVAKYAPKGGKAKTKQQLEDQLVDADALSRGGVTHYLQKIKTIER